jgi:hypothetical protein
MVMTMLACHMTAAFLISAVCAQPSPPGDLDLETTLMVTHLIIGLFCSVTRCDTLSRARHLTQCQLLLCPWSFMPCAHVMLGDS